ncbi:ArsC/Spx/MgsR family protein [Suttonella ornithocola]|uniref:Arsenate reductase n=1 Tax=Suttonella ornithocola TaxID=279832 RepID=A0A380MQN3_9GAMM|nr:ArsC/Spx/MgsR family protein [Suttonella ornithocola]SUO94910.1 arsenate reductase [Suttonella ornithocola]
MKEYLIYYNPRCGTARKVLSLLQERNLPIKIIEYLKTPPDKQTLEALAKACGSAAELLRTKEPLAKELGLTSDSDPQQIIDAISIHPELLNRPIVAYENKAIACRPAERLLEWLEYN